MIVDVRTYDIVPRQMKTYLALFEEYALPVMRQYIGEPIGYFVVEHGPLNQVVHLWGYDSLADVEEKRRARDADPRWAEYLSKGEGLVARQNNKLCRPTDWSSVK
ncbi:MAG: NIPSNAP family protein [Chloroflexota bacterium]|nr:NIPSNAP family protein [Chloroflexota bacterium]|tara:strand:- start:136 stop:450 length:315 start_codon:yes stop_codon:yes gene_type:complete